ncbi:DUF4760 domain-containing protein [Nocardia xishanensis]
MRAIGVVTQCRRHVALTSIAGVTVSAFEILSSTIAAVAVVVNIAALLFLGMQVRQGVRNASAADAARKEEWTKRRKEASMQFYMTTLERREHHRSALPPDRDRESIARFLAETKNDPAKDAAVRTYLSYLEMLGTGVNTGVLDIEIIEQFAGGSIIAAWNNYGFWIIEVREEFSAPAIYRQFEIMARAIAVERGVEVWRPATEPRSPLPADESGRAATDADADLDAEPEPDADPNSDSDSGRESARAVTGGR